MATASPSPVSNHAQGEHWPVPAIVAGPNGETVCQTCRLELERDDDQPHGYRHRTPEPAREADGTTTALFIHQAEGR